MKTDNNYEPYGNAGTNQEIKVDDLAIGKSIINLIYETRKSLDAYTRIYPDFFTPLFPLDPKPTAPEVASLMADAAAS